MFRMICAAVGLGICLTMAPSVRAADDEEVAEAKAKLAAERLQFKAELAKKQKQIDALVQLLKENNIAVPGEAGAIEAAAPVAASPASPGKGPWVVQIAANEEVSVDEARQRALSARDRLADADRQMIDAKNRLARMQDDYEYYWDNRGARQRRMKHTNADLGKARAEAARYQADRDRANRQLLQAERQIAEAGKNRQIVGHLENGTAVDIAPGNDAAAAILRGLEVGALYKVTGAGRMESGALKINAFTAVRLSAPAPAPAAAEAPEVGGRGGSPLGGPGGIPSNGLPRRPGR
jgi:hypothetical protein